MWLLSCGGAQAAHIGLHRGFAAGHEIEAAGPQRPVVHQPVDERIEAQGRHLQIQPLVQQPGCTGARHRLGEILLELVGAFEVALLHGGQLLRVLGLVHCDAKDALHLLIAGQHVQRPAGLGCEFLQWRAAQRLYALAHRFARQEGAFHHRVEQRGLVLEVPVDGAAGHARGGSHILQPRVRDATRQKLALRCVEDLVAGGFGFGFGAAGHISSVLSSKREVIGPPTKAALSRKTLIGQRQPDTRQIRVRRSRQNAKHRGRLPVC